MSECQIIDGEKQTPSCHKEGTMKQNRFARGVWTVLALSLGGGPPARAVGGAQVTGSGQFRTPYVPAVTETINAIRHSDGTVTGEFEWTVVAETGGPGATVHGQVNCLSIDGNTAFIGGVLTRVANWPPEFGFIQVGLPFYVAVQDNSQGKAASADAISLFTITD